jgi:hypothetical protein
MTEQLKKVFEPHVATVVASWLMSVNNRRRRVIYFRPESEVTIEYEVEKVSENPITGMLMYHFCIQFRGGSLWLHELAELRKRLEVFCNYEGNEHVLDDGRTYRLGDGDDEQAVFFQDGKFKIWLRSWAE